MLPKHNLKQCLPMLPLLVRRGEDFPGEGNQWSDSSSIEVTSTAAKPISKRWLCSATEVTCASLIDGTAGKVSAVRSATAVWE